MGLRWQTVPFTLNSYSGDGSSHFIVLYIVTLLAVYKHKCRR